MENTFKCSLHEKGIILEFGKEKYLMSYEQTRLPWEKGREWAKERGDDLFPWQHSIVFAEHTAEVNKMLKDAGKETFGYVLWTNREYATNNSRAWAVYVDLGLVAWRLKLNSYCVRAVSALPDDFE